MAREITAAEMTLDLVTRPRARVAAAEIDERAVLFDEDTGRLHSLDPIATVVWGCLDGTATLRDVAGEIAAAFGADPAMVADDVLRLARELGRQGVLDGVAADPALLDEPAAGEEVMVPDDRSGC